jgi:hypothetical protein
VGQFAHGAVPSVLELRYLGSNFLGLAAGYLAPPQASQENDSARLVTRGAATDEIKIVDAVTVSKVVGLEEFVAWSSRRPLDTLVATMIEEMSVAAYADTV